MRRMLVPAVALALAACSAPADRSAGTAVPDDYAKVVTVGPDAPAMAGVHNPTGSDGILIGPHYVLVFDAIGRFAEVSDADAPALGLAHGVRAPAGHEFLFAHVGAGQRGNLRNGLGGPAGGVVAADFAVTVGVRRRPLDRPRDGQAFLVVVPTGSDATLRATDAGRTQTLSLATGRRGPDAVAAYYAAQPKAYTLAAGTYYRNGRLDFYLGVTFTARISLVPYSEADGWAPDGQARLTVDLTVTTPRPDTTLVIDVPRTITLTRPGGHRITIPAGLLRGPGGGFGFHPVVPDDTVRFTLTALVSGTAKVGGRVYTLTGSTPATADVDLSWAAGTGG